MQDAFGNTQDHIAWPPEQIVVAVDSRQFAVPQNGDVFSGELNLITAANYSIPVWLEAPWRTGRRLIGTPILTVIPGPATANKTKVCHASPFLA